MNKKITRENQIEKHSNTIDIKQARNSYLYFVIGSIVVYIIAMSYLSILRFESFSASVYDLGIMIQTVWNTSKGWILQESINMGYPMMRFWMAHWEFIYLPIAIIYKLFSSPYTIIIIQTIFVASGALPVYWLAKEKLNNEVIAGVFSISYLLYPAIQNANLCDVHGVTFAAPCLLFTFYYLQKKNFKLFILFSVIALACREDSALILLMMGLYAFWKMKERKIGIIVALIGFSFFFIWYERMAIRSILGLPEFVIMEGAEAHWDHLSNMTKNPFYLITFLAKKYNIRYFFYILGPVAFLSFLSPSTLSIATPIFLINLLSSYYYTHDIEHYYSATIAPFIYISAIYGIKNLLNYSKSSNNKRSLSYISIIVFLSTLFFFYIKSNVFDVTNWKITDHHKVLKKISNEIPQEASLCAETQLAVHTAERHELYVFNDHVDEVDYILYDFYAPVIRLIDRKSFTLPSIWPDNDHIRKVLNNKDYGIIHFEDGVCLFQKGADYESGIKSLAITSDNEINNALNKEIITDIYCKGYNKYNIVKHFEQPDKLGPIFWKKAIHFTCFWNSETDSLNNCEITFQIKNENQRFSINHIPVFGLYPTFKWNKDEIIRDEIFWPVPEKAEPGCYQVYVTFNSGLEKNNFEYLFDINIE